MKISELKEKIEDILLEYKENKISELPVDGDTGYELQNVTSFYTEIIKDKLDELDMDLDSIIENINTPTDEEIDMLEDQRVRYRDLV